MKSCCSVEMDACTLARARVSGFPLFIAVADLEGVPWVLF